MRVHLHGHFAEPHHIGPHAPGLFARRAHILHRHVALPLHRMAAMVAARLGVQAVHMDQVPAAAAFVQGVDVLGDNQHLTRPFRFEARKRDMCRIGLQIEAPAAGAAHVVERVHRFRIAREGFRGRHILPAHLGPDTMGVAESIEAGFLGDAGAGQHDDMAVPGRDEPRREGTLVLAEESRTPARRRWLW